MRRRCPWTGSGIVSWGGPLLAMVLMATTSCRGKAEPPPGPFADNFDRPVDRPDRPYLGDDWRDTGGNYTVNAGRLVARNAYNHPLWLRKKLPRDATIDFDVESHSDAGDVKVELYGDGESFDPDRGGYVSSGYVLIFGGWHNSLSVICRNNEHDEGRKSSRADQRVQPGRRYHFTVKRTTDGTIDWRIDGQPFLAWTDPQPLAGRGHEYFAFNDWEAEVLFDDLSITPLAP
ncbi:MAG: hypothetical protein ABIS92_18325 [Polyangia bacterium]